MQAQAAARKLQTQARCFTLFCGQGQHKLDTLLLTRLVQTLFAEMGRVVTAAVCSELPANFPKACWILFCLISFGNWHFQLVQRFSQIWRNWAPGPSVPDWCTVFDIVATLGVNMAYGQGRATSQPKDVYFTILLHNFRV